MTKRTRLIILLICVACFFVITPILVAYSMGDRFDFEKMQIVETGGIYVRTFPAAEKIIIDSKISKKPGMFSNSIFVQSLLPKSHTVLVEKSGYYDYSKTIPVKEGQVTKIENILLFKKNIQFTVIENPEQTPAFAEGFNAAKQEKFIIKNGNLYYSNSTENSGLSAVKKAAPVIIKIIAFTSQNNNIVWLGTDGFLYKSDSTNLSAKPIKITLTAIKITKTDSYKIISNNQSIFVIANSNLLFLDTKTNDLDNFYSPVNDAKISPDGENIIYYNDNNIYISPILSVPVLKNTLYKSPSYAETSAGKSVKISDCLWLNNNYIIFTAGDKIIISEIDYRGNINAITLPQIIINSENVAVKNPQIFFNQQDGKLYILTQNTLLSSEKLVP